MIDTYVYIKSLTNFPTISRCFFCSYLLMFIQHKQSLVVWSWCKLPYHADMSDTFVSVFFYPEDFFFLTFLNVVLFYLFFYVNDTYVLYTCELVFTGKSYKPHSDSKTIAFFFHCTIQWRRYIHIVYVRTLDAFV